MKIVVISDTHGDTSAINQVLLRERGVDLYLHAGDVVAPKEAINPFAAVRGNCDGFYRQDYDKVYEYKTPFGKIHMEHIPLSDIMVEALKLEGVRIFIHGHTHVRKVEKDGEAYIFCPGSLTYPRDNNKGTYLILEVTEKEVKYTFKEI